MAQHKWHKEIKAWADGAEIEARFKDEMTGWSEWDSMSSTCRFSDDDWWEYRIKPQPKELDMRTALEIAHYALQSVAKEYPVQEAVDACERALNTKPKEPQYLYVYYDPSITDFSFWDKPLESDYDELENRQYIGKIKLEVEDE